MYQPKTTFQAEDVQLIRRELCFKGFFSLERLHFKFRRFDGSWSSEVAREVFVRGEATCVLPYDASTGQIILLEQVRAGVLLDSEQSPWLFELVAGINEAGEAPADVARREAQEEANLSLLELIEIPAFYPSPGGATERIHLFCARVEAAGAGGVYGLAEEDEDIRVHVVALEDALAMVASGQINNAPAIIAIQWLALNRAKVNKAWSASA